MLKVLDRLAGGADFNTVVEETGITARVIEAINAQAEMVVEGHQPEDLVQSREVLISTLVDDHRWRLEGDRQRCLQVSRDGFRGFKNFSDEELVEAICDAGLEGGDGVSAALERLGALMPAQSEVSGNHER